MKVLEIKQYPLVLVIAFKLVDSWGLNIGSGLV
jgi:hypothetical protein